MVCTSENNGKGKTTTKNVKSQGTRKTTTGKMDKPSKEKFTRKGI